LHYVLSFFRVPEERLRCPEKGIHMVEGNSFEIRGSFHVN
jgi:hypothetical protein